MRGIQLTALILGGVAAIGTAVFGFAAFSFLYERLTAESEERALYEPLIPELIPSCEISDDTDSQTYSLTIQSPNVSETRADIEALIQLQGGELDYVSEYTNFFFGTSRPSTRSASISLVLPLEESEAFTAKLKSMKLPGYLVFKNESTQNETTTSLRQRCTSLSNSLSQLQAEEKLYLSQFREQPTEELVEKIADVRNQAFSPSEQLRDDLLRFLNKAKITISIEELLG
ncbi:MAG: hypothetical protein Q8Q38_02330 [bacterium]|nr:hypothetical protein [bacterium]